ncbi:MAG TPA: hypothetical protein VF746_30590 [Longimicrobium sp.]|jgi:hypothetical protein
MSDPEPWDPIVDPIREIRMRISAQFDHDPVKLGEYLMKDQEQFRDRLISPGETEPRKDGKSAA